MPPPAELGNLFAFVLQRCRAHGAGPIRFLRLPEWQEAILATKPQEFLVSIQVFFKPWFAVFL
jgi:hypothetical protein